MCIQGTDGGGGDDKRGEKAANLAEKSDVEILTGERALVVSRIASIGMTVTSAMLTVTWLIITIVMATLRRQGMSRAGSLISPATKPTCTQMCRC